MSRSRRIAVLDSGVRLDHPHIAGCGEVELGPTIGSDGCSDLDSRAVDEIGHGTAVTAAILDLAPGSSIYAVRVFERGFACPVESVIAALDVALDWGPDLINVSLGATSTEFLEPLSNLVERAVNSGVQVLAPASTAGLPSYPGSLDGVEGVVADPNQPRTEPRRQEHMGQTFWFASPEPRAIEDLPPAANWSGVSFAVANVCGWLASR